MSVLTDQDTCAQLPERDEPPTATEYVAAELWVRHHFGREFESRPGATVVTTQLERFLEHWLSLGKDPATGQPLLPSGRGLLRVTGLPPDPVLRMALRVLGEDFRNPVLPALADEIRKLLDPAARASADDALRLLHRFGGALKPDMLGIQSYTPDLNLELVEVGTRKTGLGTYRELRSKLTVLEDPCGRRMRAELPALQRDTGPQVPTHVNPMASPWRLHPALMTMPLPLTVDGGKTIDWLCFWPTYRARFREHPPAPDRPGYDGLVLYHIHRVPYAVVQMPANLRRLLLGAVENWLATVTPQPARRARPAGPVLVPELAETLRTSRRLFTPEGEVFLAGLGSMALLALCGWILVEAGLVSALAGVARTGLTGLAGSPELFTGGLATAAQLTEGLWTLVKPMRLALP